MRIVALDGYTLNPGDNPWTAVEAQGEFATYDRTPVESIVERAKEAQIVVTNKAPLSRSTIEQLPNLKFIAVTATGFNIVDTSAARDRGIPVSNVPIYGTDSVAQFTFGLILELAHQIGLHDRQVRAGAWQASGDFCFWQTPLMELAGRTLGIVGLGRIGRRVAQLADAFGMRVIATSRTQREPLAFDDFEFVSTEGLFEKADIVTLHCPQTPENTGFVNASLLERMKSDAYLVNTARGALINESDLADALNAGRIAGAAVDVASAEPITDDNPLLTAKNCIITPHIAWAALEARQRLMATTAQNIAAFIKGEPQNVVN